ncbi:hypothetical protein GCM10008949_46220 [Deinococcus humi]|nr:hypothetical protein GCM10008949_46220 [Deinococcus humi]
MAAWVFIDSLWRWALVIPLGIVTLLAFGAQLRPGALVTSDGAGAELDERQLQVRNTAYLNAYRSLGTLVILGALY